MNFRLVALIAFGITMGAFCGSANAQPGLGYTPDRPTVSPYLNLLRGSRIGSLPNYYTLVRPELEQRARNRQQELQIQQLQQAIRAIPRGAAPVNGSSEAIRGTGHPTYFMNHSHYFPQPRR